MTGPSTSRVASGCDPKCRSICRRRPMTSATSRCVGDPTSTTAELPEGEVIASYGDEAVTWYTASRRAPGSSLLPERRGVHHLRGPCSGDREARPVRSPRDVAHPARRNGECVPPDTARSDRAPRERGGSGRVGSGLRRSIGPGQVDRRGAALRGRCGLVTDDVLAVDVGPPVTCEGGAGRTSPPLCRSHDRRNGSRAPHSTDSRSSCRVSRRGRHRVGDSPLTAIIIPSPSWTVGEMTVRRLRPSSALFVIRACSSRSWVDSTGHPQSRLRHPQRPRQSDPGGRSDDSVGSTVRPEGHERARRARDSRLVTARRHDLTHAEG